MVIAHPFQTKEYLKHLIQLGPFFLTTKHVNQIGILGNCFDFIVHLSFILKNISNFFNT